jgi:hypothetical protein
MVDRPCHPAIPSTPRASPDEVARAIVRELAETAVCASGLGAALGDSGAGMNGGFDPSLTQRVSSLPEVRPPPGFASGKPTSPARPRE